MTRQPTQRGTAVSGNKGQHDDAEREGADVAKRYKMADVVRQSGVGRETVRFYIREGLLPEPLRTARNMAWYSQRHLDLLRLIRQLKEEEFLPLSAIRAVLHNQEEHRFSARQRQMFALMRQRFRLEQRQPVRPHSRRKLADLLSYSAEELKAAEAVGFVREDGDALSDDEEKLLALWAEVRDSGLSLARGVDPTDFAMVQQAVERLFSDELRFFSEKLQDLDDDEVVALLQVVIPNINRMFALLHLRKVRSFVAQFDDETRIGEESSG